MKKFILFFFIALIVSSGIATTAFAQRESSTTILPEGEQISQAECTNLLVELDKEADPVAKFKEKKPLDRETVLSCAIRTGRIHFWMIPYFIVYIIEFLIGVAGLIAILFIVIGGYQLVASGANDGMKDKAKNTIKNALMGLVLALVAWVVVNVIQYVVTI